MSFTMYNYDTKHEARACQRCMPPPQLFSFIHRQAGGGRTQEFNVATWSHIIMQATCTFFMRKYVNWLYPSGTYTSGQRHANLGLEKFAVHMQCALCENYVNKRFPKYASRVKLVGNMSIDKKAAVPGNLHEGMACSRCKHAVHVLGFAHFLYRCRYLILHSGLWLWDEPIYPNHNLYRLRAGKVLIMPWTKNKKCKWVKAARSMSW